MPGWARQTYPADCSWCECTVWHNGRVSISVPSAVDRASEAALNKNSDLIASRFDRIARRYDLVNDVVSGGRARSWRAASVRAIAPRPGQKVLDLAGGTGSSAGPVAEAGAAVTVCDISTGMLAVGRSRFPNIEFVEGDALALPFADETFEVVTISFGLRNISDVPAALREMARVTRPGGRLVVTEFSNPRHRVLRAAYRPYLRFILPSVAGVITGDRDTYEYFAESIKRWPHQEELSHIIAEAGWDQVEYQDLTGGIVAIHQATKPASGGVAVGGSGFAAGGSGSAAAVGGSSLRDDAELPQVGA